MKSQTVLLLALTTVLPLLLAADGRCAPQVPSSSAIGTSQTKNPAGLMYACSICHHQVSAAQAKRLHYICPVDHGKLIPVTATLPSRPK